MNKHCYNITCIRNIDSMCSADAAEGRCPSKISYEAALPRSKNQERFEAVLDFYDLVKTKLSKASEVELSTTVFLQILQDIIDKEFNI